MPYSRKRTYRRSSSRLLGPKPKTIGSYRTPANPLLKFERGKCSLKTKYVVDKALAIAGTETFYSAALIANSMDFDTIFAVAPTGYTADYLPPSGLQQSVYNLFVHSMVESCGISIKAYRTDGVDASPVDLLLTCIPATQAQDCLTDTTPPLAWQGANAQQQYENQLKQRGTVKRRILPNMSKQNLISKHVRVNQYINSPGGIETLVDPNTGTLAAAETFSSGCTPYAQLWWIFSVYFPFAENSGSYDLTLEITQSWRIKMWTPRPSYIVDNVEHAVMEMMRLKMHDEKKAISNDSTRDKAEPR